MNKEDKKLLLCDLCARLPYGVICTDNRHGDSRVFYIDVEDERVYYTDFDEYGLIENCKPYLRPMSSMTEEEIKTLWNIWENDAASEAASKITDFLNKKYLDHHHLIDKGLALEVTKEMYR